MSERVNLTGDGAWHNVGTGPATVENLTDGVSVMVVCNTTQPTGSDGLVLTGQGANHTFQLTQTIWAQVIQSGAAAVVAVQPE
jgi:hypothetical protein